MSRFGWMITVALLAPCAAAAEEPAQAPATAPTTNAQAPTTNAQAPAAALTTNAQAPAAAQALTATASDDPNKAAEAPKPVDPASIKVERTSTGAKLFRITEGLVVEGQMQKPAAFYVLRRAAIPYDYAELRKSFLPKIGVAVKAPPF